MIAHHDRFLAGAQTGAWEFLNVAQGGGVQEEDRDSEQEPRRSSEQKASPDRRGLLALRRRASLGEPYQHETGGGGDAEAAGCRSVGSVGPTCTSSRGSCRRPSARSCRAMRWSASWTVWGAAYGRSR